MSEGSACPARWAPATLGEVARPQRPKIAPQGRPELPFIGMENVEAQTMRLLGTVPAGSMKSNAVHFLPGDVLYGRLRPYLNKVVAPSFEGLCSAEFIPLTPAPGIAHRFLQFRLNAADFVAFASRAEGDRPRVDYDRIATFPLLVPPTPEQRRIVAAIESYFTRLDDAVTSLERVQRDLKRYRASVLKAAVEGRLVPTEAELARQEGRDFEPAETLLERILVERRRRWEEAELTRMKAAGKSPKDERWKAKYKEPVGPNTEDLPELAAGWCWASLDQLLAEALANGRSVPTATTGFPVLRLTALKGEVVDLTERKVGRWTKQEAEPYLVAAGDFLVARGNGSLHLVGRGGLVAAEPDLVAYPDTLIRVRLAPGGMMPRLLSKLWSSPIVRSHLERKAKTTAGIYKVNQEDLSLTPLPLAPPSEQARLLEELDLRESVVKVVEEAIGDGARRGSALRQSILKWAFEGRLVDQDPTDEPASAVLERIEAERGDVGRRARTKVTA